VKVQCDLCKDIVVADFAVVSDGVIELACPSCRGKFSVNATRSRRVTGQEVVSGEGQRARRASMPAHHEPAMTCPKCGERQRPAPACRSCGLAAERMADFARDEEGEVSPAVQAGWQRVLGSWKDAAGHEGLAQLIAAENAYAWGARRYREVLRARGEDSVAAEQIARLARMAEATLMASAVGRPVRDAASYRGITIAVLLTLLILGGGLVFLLMRGDGGPSQGPVMPAEPVAPTPGSVTR
jgi:ribosomal protein L32